MSLLEHHRYVFVSIYIFPMHGIGAFIARPSRPPIDTKCILVVLLFKYALEFGRVPVVGWLLCNHL